MAKNEPLQILINAGTVVGSQYAQFAGVSTTDIDVTLEFVFVNPRDKTSGQVVSRVTLPKAVGLDLAKTILMTEQVHNNKKKGVQNA